MPKTASPRQTPMMRQYLTIKKGLPENTLLFFRLGDFYEMFYEDAELAASLLGITLTQRQGYPMAGVPYHAADSYINKTLAAGKKVAICEQMQPARPGQIVERRLTRILTPGTTLEDHQMEAQRNHFLLAFCFRRQQLHAAWLDLTTGEFLLASDQQPGNLLALFTAIDPQEIVLPEAERARWENHPSYSSWQELFAQLYRNRAISAFADCYFDPAMGAQKVMDCLGVLSLAGFGIDQEHPALGPAGALIAYAEENLCGKAENLCRIREYRSSGTLLLDPATLRNLEVFRTTHNTRLGSLIDAMNATVTAAGARTLERFLAAPSRDLQEIQRRQACVDEAWQAPIPSAALRDLLGGTRDLPRILGRLQNRLRNPRELGAICETLQQLPAIRDTLQAFPGPQITRLASRVHDFPKLGSLLTQALQEELPKQLTEGGYIVDGFDAELDRYRALNRDSKAWLTELELKEQVRTGIKKLRIKYNNAFGYFIEVTKANLHLVPDDYIRKQTMTNAERYYTEALKRKEKAIIDAHDNAIAREQALFRGLVAQVLAQADALRETMTALAELDVFLGWAYLAREWDYCRPDLDAGEDIVIEQGRHPVVEQAMRQQRQGLTGTRAFVANDLSLSAAGEQIAVITGPNMAGKSTYIRQAALITLMAQVGSWVPAHRCRIGVVDRIFSRVGAGDELARGHSTFMVEMNETAYILNHATDRSLIILDEIGRGTSTYDGLSIAWAVMEHLHGQGNRGPRTLFATHYHELTQLQQLLPRIGNYCVAVKEWNDEIIFVRRVVRGTTDRSYGIHVARLAGLPQSVIQRAEQILQRLEAEGASHHVTRRPQRAALSDAQEKPEPPKQMQLF